MFELFRKFYGTEEYLEEVKTFRRAYITLVADQNASLGSFCFWPCTSNIFPTTMVTLPVKTQEFELKKATGLQKGAVEGGVVLVSDGLDCPRECNMVYMVLAQII